MRDAAITIALVAGFAGLVTAHVATLFGLVKNRQPARALGALAVPPLAPYWALSGGMKARGAIWLACAALYAAAFVVARS